MNKQKNFLNQENATHVKKAQRKNVTNSFTNDWKSMQN